VASKATLKKRQRIKNGHWNIFFNDLITEDWALERYYEQRLGRPDLNSKA